MNNTFVVNGKTYNSLEEMPPDVRAQFDAVSNVLADKNQNGVPDIMENLVGNATTIMNTGSTVMQTSAVVFEGKTYNKVEDLPPEGRAAYEKAMGKLADEDHDGVPDVIENAIKNAPTMASTQITAGVPRVITQTDTNSNIGPVIVLSIVAIGLAIALALLLFLVLNKAGR